MNLQDDVVRYIREDRKFRSAEPASTTVRYAAVKITELQAMEALRIKDKRTLIGHLDRLQMDASKLTNEDLHAIRVSIENFAKRPNALKNLRKKKSKARR